MIIGITGGIGSGKSTVCDAINKMGYPVFYSDTQGRLLLRDNHELKCEIRDYFGDDVFENDEIVRSKLGAIVFNDKEKLDYLNLLIHPRVKRAFVNWVSIQKSLIVFKESAILFESKDTSCDQVWSVITELEERIYRVKKRDQVSREEIISRINNQMSDKERIHLSNKIINNNKYSLIIPQIIKHISALEN